jgi:hypothetical protein
MLLSSCLVRNDHWKGPRSADRGFGSEPDRIEPRSRIRQRPKEASMIVLHYRAISDLREQVRRAQYQHRRLPASSRPVTNADVEPESPCPPCSPCSVAIQDHAARQEHLSATPSTCDDVVDCSTVDQHLDRRRRVVRTRSRTVADVRLLGTVRRPEMSPEQSPAAAVLRRLKRSILKRRSAFHGRP